MQAKNVVVAVAAVVSIDGGEHAARGEYLQ
jgi:hypothetical protein